MFVVRHVLIHLKGIQFIVRSFPTSNTGMTLLGMSFFYIFRRAWVYVKKKTHVNLLSSPLDGRSIFRPAYVTVYMWVWGTRACVGFTGVSPFKGLGPGAFMVGKAALKVTSTKVFKNEKTYLDNQHAFITFVFDIFRFLAPDVDLLHIVQRVIQNNILSPRSMNVVFTRINFSIQKSLATQLVALLPSTHV